MQGSVHPSRSVDFRRHTGWEEKVKSFSIVFILIRWNIAERRDAQRIPAQEGPVEVAKEVEGFSPVLQYNFLPIQ